MRPATLLKSTLAIALFATASGAFAAQGYGPAYSHGDPAEAMEQRGFHDGVEGAERDFKNHRRPDVNNRNEYRDPDSVPGWAQHEYREGFRRGYYLRVHQIYDNEGLVYGHRDGDFYGPR